MGGGGGGEQGEGSYDVLNREQFGTVMDPKTIHEEVKTFNYSKLELADSKFKFEKNPAYATTTQSDACRTTYYAALVHAV